MKGSQKKQNTTYRSLLGLFFLSGLASLIYQVVWHRVLYSIYGINIESVSLVVAAFMLGLGVGSIVGGKLPRSLTEKTPFIFASIELIIAIYGALSLNIIFIFADLFNGTSKGYTFLGSFLSISIPTLLMGATLPILAQYFSHKPNSLTSINDLYFANTIGAALGAAICSPLILPVSGLLGAVYLAASINIYTGILALMIARTGKQ